VFAVTTPLHSLQLCMSWMDNHSGVEEGVTVVSCRIKGLLFVDDLVLLASSQQSLQHPLIGSPLRATVPE